MRSLVVYESMYGNTHRIAEVISERLRRFGESDAVPVDHATPDRLEGLNLLVVGGPTHAHAMSRPATRRSAPEAASKPGTDLTMEPGWDGDGVREWLASLDLGNATPAAAFDTRIAMSPLLTGRASKGIAKRLREHGFELIGEPESFLVTKENHLSSDEEAHAQDWASSLAETLERTESQTSPRRD